jgi:hypothetical protein
VAAGESSKQPTNYFMTTTISKTIRTAASGQNIYYAWLGKNRQLIIGIYNAMMAIKSVFNFGDFNAARISNTFAAFCTSLL